MNSSVIEFLSFGKTTYLVLYLIGIISVIAVQIFNEPKALQDRKRPVYVLTLFLALFLFWRIGWLPIGYGVSYDRENYSWQFNAISQYGILDTKEHDYILGYIMLIASHFGDVKTFFILQAALYVGLYYFVCTRLVKNNSFWLLLGCALSFGFISYGINTLRAGLAVAFLLMGLTYQKSLWKELIFFFLAVGTHFSMSIPIIMILISKYYPRTKLFFLLWILSIPVSFIAGHFFNNLFAEFTEDSRREYLTTATSTIYNVGFRIDFILYSMLPFAIGYYYIFVRGFKDKLYVNLYNAYILTNIFWILVIRANFSDRFAYLSWFMIPFILLYPLLKDGKVVNNATNWLSLIILGETAFLYLF